MEKKDCLILYLFILVVVFALLTIICVQANEIEEIKNTNYEFCFQGTCYYQRIGEYLEGEE